MIALVLAAGCRRELDPQQAVVLEGFSYGWELFNHRLSHLEVVPVADSVAVAVIGGTSTTSVLFGEPPAECEGCEEFPFVDRSEVEVRWAKAETTATALATARAELEAGADGASATLEIPVPEVAGEEAVAVLAGLTLSTDVPLATGPSCYQPIYGWHPREIRVALGDPKVADGVARVEVTAAFAAGNTLEEERACIDEVNEHAVVAFAVDVLVAVGRDPLGEQAELHAEAAYPFSGDPIDPEPQEDPAPSDLGLDVGDDALLGFSELRFRFHESDPEARGAYLRTLGFRAEPDGTAAAAATNYSVGTQLSDFSFVFDGTVRTIATGGTVERGTVTAELTTDLEDDGTPVQHVLDY